MSWKETDVLKQRKEFIETYLKHDRSFKTLCQDYGISEKTGHKWKKRFLEKGFSGLQDESKAPEHSPNQLSEEAVIRILKLKEAHPFWGAKKLQVLYEKNYPRGAVPSVSSMNRILKKAGLTKTHHHRNVASPGALFHQGILAQQPNDVWTVDFKGWWWTADEKCLPLTIRDAASRKILTIQLMASESDAAVRPVFQKLFQTYGLPAVIRSDNGPPFAASNGPLGLTSLSVWWITLGIRPDRITPGCPGQNGAHERMHADMCREIEKVHTGNLKETQAYIDRWVLEYNTLRPHEALQMATPDSVYTPSNRAYTGDVDQLTYPLGYLRRKVSHNGIITFNGQRVYIGYALRGCTIGLLPLDADHYRVDIAEIPIGIFSAETYSFEVLSESL